MSDQTSDIVERLRSKSTDCHASEEALYLEAAEEIERLRAAMEDTRHTATAGETNPASRQPSERP
jgi:hypothetical protein